MMAGTGECGSVFCCLMALVVPEIWTAGGLAYSVCIFLGTKGIRPCCVDLL